MRRDDRESRGHRGRAAGAGGLALAVMPTSPSPSAGVAAGPEDDVQTSGAAEPAPRHERGRDERGRRPAFGGRQRGGHGVDVGGEPADRLARLRRRGGRDRHRASQDEVRAHRVSTRSAARRRTPPPAARPASPTRARCARRRWRRPGVAPAATIACTWPRSRTPPAAFTPMLSPTTRRISATSATVAPPGPKPVDVLTKSAPAALASVQAVTFSSSVSSAASMITLLVTPQARQARGHRLDVLLDQPQIARLERADVDHHVDLGGAVEDRAARLVVLHVGGRRAQREADHRADADAGAAQLPRRQRHPRRVDAHRRETSARRPRGTTSRCRRPWRPA